VEIHFSIQTIIRIISMYRRRRRYGRSNRFVCGYVAHRYGPYGIVDHTTDSTELTGRFTGDPYRVIMNSILAYKTTGLLRGISNPPPLTVPIEIYLRCDRPKRRPKMMRFICTIAQTNDLSYAQISSNTFAFCSEKVTIANKTVEMHIRNRFKSKKSTSVPMSVMIGNPDPEEINTIPLNLYYAIPSNPNEVPFIEI